MKQDALPYPLKGPIFILYSPAQEEKVGHFMLPSPGDWPVLHPPEHLEGPHQQVLISGWEVQHGSQGCLCWFLSVLPAALSSEPLKLPVCPG